jgi:hypothetical protein
LAAAILVQVMAAMGKERDLRERTMRFAQSKNLTKPNSGWNSRGGQNSSNAASRYLFNMKPANSSRS